eukprot:2356788-Pyramimonas_sp.AAC.1
MLGMPLYLKSIICRCPRPSNAPGETLAMPLYPPTLTESTYTDRKRCRSAPLRFGPRTRGLGKVGEFTRAEGESRPGGREAVAG